MTWILICCQVACNLFLAGCNMVLFIFFPICNIASFVERRLSLPDTILSLQVTLGIQKSNQQDGQLEALGVFWRSGGLLSAFIEKITITARWRWSAGAYISRPINFCRNKLLSLDSPFSGKFPNKNHFLCNFQRDEEACNHWCNWISESLTGVQTCSLWGRVSYGFPRPSILHLRR